MQPASSYPAPDPGGGVKNPGPAIVPALPAKKPRTALWGIALAVVLLAGGIGLYVNNQSQAKTSGGGPPVVTVATVAVGLGDLNASIRVNGTVAAQNFAALL